MSHNKNRLLGLMLSGLSALTISHSILAQQPVSDENQKKGYDIAARSERSDRGFQSSTVQMTMTLRNAAGQESQRSLKTLTLEVPNEALGDKSLVLFETPKDIKGTALLSHAKILEADDQWLFLPALKRVKRIASSNKSGPFVGSEFAFEDFTAVELNKYSYNYLGEGMLDDLKVDIVERFPKYENSGYTRQISWVDQTIFQVRKIEFYDRRNDLLKTLTLEDYRQYDDVWRPHSMKMVNHKTKKSTDLVYSDYQFKTGLTDNDFTKGKLKTLR